MSIVIYILFKKINNYIMSLSLSNAQITYVAFITGLVLLLCYKSLDNSAFVTVPNYQAASGYNNIMRGLNTTVKMVTTLGLDTDMYRPKYIDRRQGVWQAQKLTQTADRDDVVFAMHAYYDDRPVLNGKC